MMRQGKKWLCLFLCFVMCFSLLPTWAVADDGTDEVLAADEVPGAEPEDVYDEEEPFAEEAPEEYPDEAPEAPEEEVPAAPEAQEEEAAPTEEPPEDPAEGTDEDAQTEEPSEEAPEDLAEESGEDAEVPDEDEPEEDPEESPEDEDEVSAAATQKATKYFSTMAELKQICADQTPDTIQPAYFDPDGTHELRYRPGSSFSFDEALEVPAGVMINFVGVETITIDAPLTILADPPLGAQFEIQTLSWTPGQTSTVINNSVFTVNALFALRRPDPTDPTSICADFVNNGTFNLNGTITVTDTDAPDSHLKGLNLSLYEKKLGGRSNEWYEYTPARNPGSGGQCGDSVIWSLKNGVLTVSGTGAMWDFDPPESVPGYYGKSGEIRAIVIEAGVTRIGSCAFRELANAVSVSFTSDVTEIGDRAFIGCISLNTITVTGSNPAFAVKDGVLFTADLSELVLYPGGKTDSSFAIPTGTASVRPYAAATNYNLHSLAVSGSVALGEFAFYNCPKLSRIDFTKAADGLQLGYCAFNVPDVAISMAAIEETWAIGTVVRLPGTEADGLLPAVTGYPWAEDYRLASFEYAAAVGEDAAARLKLLPITGAVTSAAVEESGVYNYFPRVELKDGNAEETETLVSDVFYAVSLDCAWVAKDAYTFKLRPQFEDENGKEIAVSKSSIKYSSNDAKIAAVGKAEADGSVTVTVKAGANGVATITGTSQKISGTVLVYVRDYAPRLESDKITLNSLYERSTQLYGGAAYDNLVSDIHIKDEKDPFTLEIDREEDYVGLKAKQELKNGTYKTTLVWETDFGIYETPLTVTVKNAVPAITVKQATKLNTFYRQGVPVEITAAIGSESFPIESAEFETKDLLLVFGEYGDVYIQRKADSTGTKPVTKGTLKVKAEGFRNEITKQITVATENRKPTVKPSATSFNINTALGDDTTVMVRVNQTDKDPYSGQPYTVPLELDEEDVSLLSGEADLAVSDGGILLKLKGTKPTTVKFRIQLVFWAEAMDFSVKLNVSTKAPTVKVAPASVQVNAAYPGATSVATLALSDGNYRLAEVKFDKEYDRLKVWYESEDGIHGRICASPEGGLKAGTYKYTLTPVLADGESTELKTVPFTVKVVNTTKNMNPAVKTIGSIDVLNSGSVITCQVTKIPNLVNPMITGISLSGKNADEEHFTLYYNGDPGDSNQAYLMVKNPEQLSVKKTYQIQLAVTVADCDAPFLTKTLNIKVKQGTLKVTLGQQFVTVFQGAGNQLCGAVMEVAEPYAIQDVRLNSKTPALLQKALGKDAEILWATGYDEATDELITGVPASYGVAAVMIKNPGVLQAGKSYKLTLDVYPSGMAADGKPTAVTLTLSVKK